MRHRSKRRLAIAAAVAVAVLGIGPIGAAEAQPAGVAAVELNRPNTRLLRRLDQFDALTGEQQWAEAVELLDAIMADPSSRTSVVETSPGRFLPLADACLARLATAPAEAIAFYRNTTDATAKQKTLQGIKNRDERLLREVAERLFLSQWGDDAAVALGDIALERGDFAAARRWWRLAHPMLSDPGGRTLAWALRGVDLKQHGDEVRRRLEETPRSAGRLAHPDPDVPLADLLARLVIASAHEGSVERAEAELKILQALTPGATGRLAGAEGDWAALLAAVIEEAKARNTSAAAPALVGDLTGRLWAEPRPLTTRALPVVRNDPFALPNAAGRFVAPRPEPLVQPTAWGRVVLLRDGGTLHGIDLLTGGPAVVRSGELYAAGTPTPAAAGRRGIIVRGAMQAIQTGRPIGGDIFGEPVTVSRGAMYARVGPRANQPAASPNREGPGWRIIGRDLRRENRGTIAIEPPEPPWEFAGPPAVRGGRVLVALRADNVRPRVALACYSSATGEPLWQTPLASAAPAGAFDAPFAAPRITLGGEAAYVATGCGATAAVDLPSGAVRWIAAHAAAEKPEAAANAPSLVLASDRLFVAPARGDQIEAIDTATGRRLWIAPSPTREAELLGATGGVLVVGGHQLAGLSIHDGQTRYLFPDTPKAGIRGRGRGCLAGGEVFWPTRQRVLAFDATTGQATRQSLDVADLGGEGATLTPSLGCLIVAGSKAMTVYGPIDLEKGDLEKSGDGPRLSSLSLPLLRAHPRLMPGGSPR